MRQTRSPSISILVKAAIGDRHAKRVGGEAVFVGFRKAAVSGGADSDDSGAVSQVSGKFHAFSSAAADARIGDHVLQLILFDALFLRQVKLGERVNAIASIVQLDKIKLIILIDLGQRRWIARAMLIPLPLKREIKPI